MELGTILATSWSAGISLYAVIAALGIAGRIGWVETSSVLQEPAVIVVALLLAVVDVVIDKIAWLDSVWDLVHTAVRPLGGAAIGWLAPDQTVGPDLPDPAVLAVVGGVLAFSAHAAKMSVRAAVNASPEPASNIVVSLLEDGLVATLLALAFAYPVLAGVVASILLVTSIIVTIVLFRTARRMWRRLRHRRRDGTRSG